MDYVVSLHGQAEVTFFEAKRYTVDVLGGWGVKLHDFSLHLKNTDTDEVVVSRKAIWPAQSYAFNKRKKRILTFEIKRRGTYLIEMKNPERMEVKPSNLFFTSLFEEPIPNSEVQLYIHE